MSSIFPPTDLLPPRRGGHPSPSTASAAARPAGFARLAGARRGLFRSARALAAAALLALTGALALPATAEAQTDNTAPTLSDASVSNSGSFVKLTFSEDLDLPDGPLSETAQAAFSLIVDDVKQEFRVVDRVLADLLSIEPLSTIYAGQTVVVSYTSPPPHDPIADADGNEVAISPPVLPRACPE